MTKFLSGRTALVVEDEMLVLLNIEDVLADCDCSAIAVAATVDQALALIAANAFDVAILDVNLNGNASYPVADELTARGIPFVYSTGYRDGALGGSFGERPVLMKPYRDEQLVAALQQLIDERDSRRSKQTSVG